MSNEKLKVNAFQNAMKLSLKNTLTSPRRTFNFRCLKIYRHRRRDVFASQGKESWVAFPLS